MLYPGALKVTNSKPTLNDYSVANMDEFGLKDNYDYKIIMMD